MKRILKNKRGMAMESAIMFMLLIFTLGMLMTGTSMIMHLRVRLNDKTIQREITIEQIGEDFVADKLTNGQVIDGYVAEINDDKTILRLTNKVGTVLLYIEKNGSTVLRWQYS